MIFRARIASTKIRLFAAAMGVLLFTATLPFIPSAGRLTHAQSETPQTIGLFDLPAAAQNGATILGASQDAHLSGNGNIADLTTSNRARAIAVGDVNGDGIPDLIVGAPDSNIPVTPPGAPPQI